MLSHYYFPIPTMVIMRNRLSTGDRMRKYGGWCKDVCCEEREMRQEIIFSLLVHIHTLYGKDSQGSWWGTSSTWIGFGQLLACSK